MKVSDILEAVVRVPREEFEQKLNANKAALQKPRTQGGVLKVLRSLFPDINFSKDSYSGDANYDPKEDLITIFNRKGLMKQARKDWDDFSTRVSDLLAHEHIHKEQNSRRGGYKERGPAKISPEKVEAFKKKYKEVLDTYDDLMADKVSPDHSVAQNLMNTLQQMQKKAKQHNINVKPTYDNYLGDRDEIGAYAETIAAKLMRKFGDKQKAIQALQSGNAKDIDELDRYIQNNGNNKKVMNQLYKEVVGYLN